LKLINTLICLLVAVNIFASYKVQIVLPEDEGTSYKVNIEFNTTTQNNNYYYLNTATNNINATGFKSNIKNIYAEDGLGNPIKVKVKSNTTLQLKKAKNLKVLRYEIELPFALRNKNNFLAGGLIKKDSFHLINFNSLIGYLNDKIEEKIQVDILLSNHSFEVHSVADWTQTDQKIHFNFDNYQDLFDTPVMLNQMVSETFKLDSTDFKIASNQFDKQKKIVKWIIPVINAIKEFTGDFVEKEYQFLIYIDEERKITSSENEFGALHKNNTSLYAIPSIQNERKTKYLVQRAAMHELLHLFIPKRLKSDKRNTKHMWLYEGTVEYFSLLLLLRSGLISEKRFWNEWERKIQHTESYPIVSLTDLSENRQASYYQNSIKNFYNKAALVSFFLDIEINAISKNKTALIDVLLKLEEATKEFGFKDDELVDWINKLSNIDLTSFYEKYILNRSNLKYNAHFGKIGILFKPKYYKRINSFGSLTISYDKKGKFFVVKQAHQNTLNAKQGDIITSINNVVSSKVSARMFYDQILNPKFNQELSLTILRNNEILQLKGKAEIQDSKLQFYRLLDMKDINDKQKLLRYNVFGTAL